MRIPSVFLAKILQIALEWTTKMGQAMARSSVDQIKIFNTPHLDCSERPRLVNLWPSRSSKELGQSLSKYPSVQATHVTCSIANGKERNGQHLSCPTHLSGNPYDTSRRKNSTRAVPSQQICSFRQVQLVQSYMV